LNEINLLTTTPYPQHTQEEKVFLITRCYRHTKTVKVTIPFSDVVITNCSVCGKEMEREYV